MSIKEEYFVLEEDYLNTAFLEFNEEYYQNDRSEIDSISFDKPAYVHNPIQMIVQPIGEPKFTDFIFESHPILKNNLLELLLPLKLVNTSHFPVRILHKGNFNNDYFMWYIYNTIHCLDATKTDGRKRASGSYALHDMKLDFEKLGKIPLEKRLVFRLGGSVIRIVIHKTLVDMFKNAKVTGVEFYPTEKWKLGIK